MKHNPKLLLLGMILTAGCQQQMADQPSYRPLTKSRLFPGEMSAQPLPRGVVAREWFALENPLTSGLKPEFRNESAQPTGDMSSGTITPAPSTPVDPSRFVDAFPFEPTRADLVRGQERYTIYCALCHDPLGTGRGKIVERGYLNPPNFHTDTARGFRLYSKSIPLRNVPVGYIFEVITRGYGAMPRYGPQIHERDRWCIIAYVRALQLSQNATIADLPEAPRQNARKALGVNP